MLTLSLSKVVSGMLKVENNNNKMQKLAMGHYLPGSIFPFLALDVGPWGPCSPGGTPTYELYRYVPHFRVWFSSRFSLK